MLIASQERKCLPQSQMAQHVCDKNETLKATAWNNANIRQITPAEVQLLRARLQNGVAWYSCELFSEESPHLQDLHANWNSVDEEQADPCHCARPPSVHQCAPAVPAGMGALPEQRLR